MSNFRSRFSTGVRHIWADISIGFDQRPQLFEHLVELCLCKSCRREKALSPCLRVGDRRRWPQSGAVEAEARALDPGPAQPVARAAPQREAAEATAATVSVELITKTHAASKQHVNRHKRGELAHRITDDRTSELSNDCVCRKKVKVNCCECATKNYRRIVAHNEQLQQSVTKDVPDKPDRAKSIDAGSKRGFKSACTSALRNTTPFQRNAKTRNWQHYLEINA